jgi:hypothetical protein
MKRRALATLILFSASWAWVSAMAVLKLPHAAEPDAMTVGCGEATCCSSRCYLDKDGVHHCVPRKNASCSCGLSSQERESGTLPLLEAGPLPSLERLQHVDTSPVAMICSHPTPLHYADLAVPTPPPRMSLPA